MGLRSLLGRTSKVEMISPTSEMASIDGAEVAGRMLWMAMLRASVLGCWASDLGVTLGIYFSGFRGRPTSIEIFFF